jgi:hypothetical protein
MVEVTKLTPEMFPELRDGLLRELDAKMPKSRWRRCFVDMADAELGAGYALVDGGKIVGVLGTIYSERTIRGKTARFCNLHSWYVRPEHRGKSLLLMRPVLKLSDHTITDFSPTRSVVAISRRLGFEPLDSSARLLLPMLGRAEDISEVDDATAATLSDADERIYRDHSWGGCRHLLFTDARGYCYVVASKVQYRWFSYCAVHYISDRQRFVEHQAAFRTRMMELTRTRAVLLESRQLEGVWLARSLNIATYDKLFRPAGVAASDVDSLYSDAVNLGLSAIPRLRTLIAGPVRKRVGRWRGGSAKAIAGLLHGMSACWSGIESAACLLG